MSKVLQIQEKPWLKISLLIFLAGFTLTTCQVDLLYQWQLLRLESPFHYQTDKTFIPENNVFTGLEVGWDRIFLSIPRLRRGVPATLTWIPRSPEGEVSTPVLRPYPNWDFQSYDGPLGNCSGLVSVYRTRADRCNRLWVLDSGVSYSLEDFTIACPPKILIFDMATDQLVKTIEFPRDVRRPNTLLTNLVIDDLTGYGSCDNAFVYLTDTAGFGIVVYDARKDLTWRVSHPYMYPQPDFSSYTVSDETFTLPDGIIGLGLSPVTVSGSRVLYFQPLATPRIYAVDTSVLQSGPVDDLPVQIVAQKSSQGLGLAVNPNDGSVLFSPVQENAVVSWQPATNTSHVLAYDPQLLDFPSELLIAERDNNNLWLLATRFQKFFRKTVVGGEINLRILRVNLGVPVNNFLTYKR